MEPDRITQIEPIQIDTFARGTWGSRGMCSFCLPRRGADYMGVSVKTGKRYALCRFHTLTRQMAQAGVPRADVRATKAAIGTMLRKTRRGKWTAYRIEPGAIRCQAQDCTQAATMREEWQSTTMPVPAFSYLCTRDFAATHAGPRDNTRLVEETP